MWIIIPPSKSPWGVRYLHCWPLVLIAWVSMEEPWVAGMEGDTSLLPQLSWGSHFYTKLQGGRSASKSESTWAHPSSSVQTSPKQRRPAGALKVIPQATTLHFKGSQIPQGHMLSRKLGALTLVAGSSLLLHGNQLSTSSLQLDSHKWEVLHASSRPPLSPCPRDALLKIGSWKLIRIRMQWGEVRERIAGWVLGPLFSQNYWTFHLYYSLFLQLRGFEYILWKLRL